MRFAASSSSSSSPAPSVRRGVPHAGQQLLPCVLCQLGSMGSGSRGGVGCDDARAPSQLLPGRPVARPHHTHHPTTLQLWRWRARARRHRHDHQRAALALPPIDWTRQNVQLLFVDATGTLRARLAAGLAERVADWCGLGRAVAPAAAGVDVEVDTLPSPSTFASLAAQASRLGLRARPFTAPPEPFEAADLDRYDLVIALDAASLAVVREAAADADDPAFYTRRIATLASFAPCRGPRPLARVGSDTLDPTLAAVAAAPPPGAAAAAARADGVPRALLSGSQTDFDAMTWHVVVGVAGLVQYLDDALAGEAMESEDE